MANVGPINKEDFSKFDAKTQRSIMYGYLLDLNAAMKKQQRNGLFDKTASFLGGIIGGFAAIVGKTLIWR